MLMSHWQLSCGYPQYGSVIRKFERLSKAKIRDICQVEIKNADTHVSEFDFLIEHNADNWLNLMQEVLLVAKHIYPVWEMTLARNDDIKAVQYFQNQYPPINNIQWIRWHINLSQDYLRTLKP